MSAGIKANVDGSAAIQVGGTDVITLTSGGAATFVTSPTTVQAGTAAAPSITFSGDTNTGIYSPGADQVAIATGGTAAVTVNNSQNVGIGTTSPSNKLHVNGVTRISGVSAGSTALFIPAGDIVGDVSSGSMAIGNLGDSSSETRITTRGFTTFRTGATDGTNGTERARITSGGDFLVGTTSAGGKIVVAQTASSTNAILIDIQSTTTTFNRFTYQGSSVGSISYNGSSTVYATSSDYRLKENIQPMTGALAKVAALKPCTYKWKIDGSDGQGFIAHELAEVCPQAVVGEKDAVETYTDEEGNEQTRPAYQGVDTSFLIATLTAAIQEQQAMIDELKAKVAALEGA